MAISMRLRFVLVLAVSFFIVSCSGSSSGGNGSSDPAAVLNANFDYSIMGHTVAFTDKSTATVKNIESYLWNFGDGGTSAEQSPTHTYSSPGAYNVSLTIKNTAGTSNVKSQSITVSQASLNAGFEHSITGRTVTFTDRSTASGSDINSYLWEFGDGKSSTDKDPVHIYNAPGPYQVSLTIKNTENNKSLKTNSVTVELAIVSADFLYEATNLTVSFKNMSTISYGVASYSWNFGDGVTSTEKDPTHTYALAGSYKVKLTVSDDVNTMYPIERELTVKSGVHVVAYSWTVNKRTVTFHDNTILSDANKSFLWEFGDGMTATVQHPVHTYATGGKYNVRLTITSMGDQSSTLHEVSTGPEFTSISGGSSYGVGLTNFNEVYSWGHNKYGNLGIGLGGAANMASPVKVNAFVGKKIIAVSAHYGLNGLGGHTLAITDGGKVYSWGSNLNGQLGLGDKIDRDMPKEIIALSGKKIVAVSAGADFSLALTDNGKVWAWGFNKEGQLGTGNNNTLTLPVEIASLSDIKTISAGERHSLAVSNTGKAYAWGTNDNFQLGIEVHEDINDPMLITSLANVKNISAGRNHSLAVTADGKTYAWGRNDSFQLGINQEYSDIPMEIPTLSGVNIMSVSAGDSHSLAVATNGKIYGWGDNNDGRLCLGTEGVEHTPAEITALSGISSAFTGSNFSFAVTSIGDIYACGNNNNGRLGTGNTVASLNPVQIMLSGTSIVQTGFNCDTFGDKAVCEDNSTVAYGNVTAYSWKIEESPYTGNKVTNKFLASGDYDITYTLTDREGVVHPLVKKISIAKFIKIRTGDNFALGLTEKGKVYAWGDNSDGQLGIGVDIDESLFPKEVTALSGIKSIAAGVNHSLALTADGKIYSWGRNHRGQLGITPAGQDFSVPNEVLTLNDRKIVDIDAGDDFSVAITDDGRVYSWGFNNHGQLGIGNDSSFWTPKPVEELLSKFIVEIAAGSTHVLARNLDGKVYAWGRNYNGELGNGSFRDSKIPLEITTLPEVKRIAAGTSYSLAVTTDGKGYAWGENYYGKLGVGDDLEKDIPNEITSVRGFENVSAGKKHSLGFNSEGKVYSWGSNDGGRLGRNDTWYTDIPEAIVALSMEKITAVSAGFDCSLALTDSGIIWAWGWNESGQLGLGYRSADNFIPTKIVLKY